MFMLFTFSFVWIIYSHAIVTGIKERDYGLIGIVSVTFLISIVVGLFCVIYLWSC
jgi:hypothetical protein